MKKLLIIVGPTASGKSALAFKAAEMLGSKVISCDSMQIYTDMNIGTAKECSLSALEKQLMVNIVPPTAEFSVAQYQKQADSIIEKLSFENKTPIFCGGTGLYVEAIIYPLNFSDTDRNTELRDALSTEYDRIGGEMMLDKLRQIDEEAALKLHPNDKKRIIRALEIINLSGKKVLTEVKLPRYEYTLIGLNTDRELLYKNINRRVDLMFEHGLTAEVKWLLNNGVSFNMQSMQAIGYKEFKGYFDGEISENDVKELIKKNTRNYAKRQITWFKRYKDIVWFDSAETEKALVYIKNSFTE
jgi:tRNA dimethylallyltransferase